MPAHRATLPIYGLTIFLGAGLLFLLQLIFARLALPLLGGTPAVWNTAMVFYQAVLLAGYGYAHFLTSRFKARAQISIHAVVLILPWLFLPFAIPGGWQPPADGSPVFWLLGLLAVAVGVPFFAVSATSPLLQKWFSSTGHVDAHDPYFLYAASNAGSLLGLLGYPLLIEPHTTLGWQAGAWAIGFGLLMIFSFISAAFIRPIAQSPPLAEASSQPVTARRRLKWTVCALVPSSLMLSVTAYISSDIAAVPMLWALPLALYLVTFIIVFSRHPVISHRVACRALPLLLVSVVMVLVMGATTPMALLAGLHLLAFFIAALVCHGELAKDRPPSSHLTEFYLWMSVGGVLGGMFNALLSPVIFASLIEYPAMIVAAAWLGLSGKGASIKWRDFPLAALPAILALALLFLVPHGNDELEQLRKILVFGIPALLCFLMSGHGFRFALALGGIFLAGRLAPEQGMRTLFADRGFFGIHRVTADRDGKFHYLFHGKTVHGVQSLDPALRRVPLSYYHPTGPLGQVFAAKEIGPVAAVGLGAGAAAMYGKAGQEFTFYEIDPIVKAIASDSRYFTYLSDSPAKVDIVIGDARLKLGHAPDSHYDLLILDAYGSDSVPVHLLTREALQLYLGKLSARGIIAFHISNLHMDLRPVVGNLAADAGLQCLFQEDADFPEEEATQGKAPSRWAVMARTAADLEPLSLTGKWDSLEMSPGMKVWTDDYSSILPILDFHLR